MEENNTVVCGSTNRDSSQTDGVPVYERDLNNLASNISSLSLAYDVSYSMKYKRKGNCVIFNQKRFGQNLRLKSRTRTNVDRDEIYTLFKSFGFEVFIHNEFTKKRIKKILTKYAYRVDHSDFACFVVVILVHGKSGLSEDIFNDFSAENCPTLASKPKMFFIQACRGNKFETTHELRSTDSEDQLYTARLSCDFSSDEESVYYSDQMDSPHSKHSKHEYSSDEEESLYSMHEYRISNHADFLICWSTGPGYFSWHDKKKGSWFIQSLVSVFRKHAHTMDVQSMMTIVNRHMIQNFESSYPRNVLADLFLKKNGKMTKQCSCTISSLMRLIYLEPPL